MDDVHLRRRLTAVLLADVVGYSRLMSVDEEGTHLRLAGYLQSLIDPAVAKHRGRLIRSMGDGMLVEFDSALDAVRCGIEIQRGLAEGEANQNERRIQLRIGVNTGDVIVDERDIYGNSINIAARLEGLAEPGQIYVTRGVRDQLLGYPNLSFEDKGERRVKNIDRPIRVYCVKHTPDGRPSPSKTAGAGLSLWTFAKAVRSGPRATLLSTVVLAAVVTLGISALPTWRDRFSGAQASILVLPFSNFSGDASQDYLADAVTDDLTTDLSRLADTLVIASGTAFTYKGKAVDERTIGQECGVRYILEGSVSKIGKKVQTNARLIDTSSGTQIWGDRFESDFVDLGELQDAITGRIASSLRIQLVKAEDQRSFAERPTDPDAYDMRLRAMAYLVKPLTPENTLAARHYLEQAVALDPNSAEAWADLANVLVIDFLRSWNNATQQVVVQAKEAVRKAYAINPSIAVAHLAEGKIREIKGDLQGEIDALNGALQLDPSLSVVYAHKANALILLGRAQEAPELLTKAIQLSPRDPDLGLFYWFMGRAYFNMKNYEDAIHWLKKSVQERPTTWFSWAHLISAYALTGRLGETDARAAVEEYRRRFKADWPLDPNIKHYYTQAKYRDAPPELQASLQEYLRGLQIAKQTAGFP